MVDFDKAYASMDATAVGKTWKILEDFYFHIARFDEGNFPNSFFEAVATFIERYY